MAIRTLPWQLQTESANDSAGRGGAMNPAMGMRLVSSLHRSLDPARVLAAFYDEIKPLLGLDGIRCRFDSDAPAIELGQEGAYLTVYSVTQEPDPASELTFSRDTAFADDEIALMEAAIELLHPALRNGLLYQAAVGASRLDAVTGLGNRLALEEALIQQLAAVERHDQALSVALIELDDSRAVDEDVGIQMRDRTLAAVGDALSHYARRCDSVFRYSGDCFAVVMPHTDGTGAIAAAERFRAALTGTQTAAGGLGVAVTTGCSSALTGDTPASLVKRAEAVLKTKRRARVVAA